MPNTYRVSEPLNMRTVPSLVDNAPIAVLPAGTLVEEIGRDGRWFHVRVSLNGSDVEGWVSSLYLTPLVGAGGTPTNLSNALFNTERRSQYIDSILGSADLVFFFSPSEMAWGNGHWYHGAQGTDGLFYDAAIDWVKSQNEGLIVLTRPRTQITKEQFDQRYCRDKLGVSTYCNFNISYCYKQVYGGDYLQDPDGTGPGRERTANILVAMFKQDWKTLTPAEAAQIGNAGGFVVAGWINPNPGSGHVVFLIEGSDPNATDTDALCCFHIGGGPPRRTTISGAFGQKSPILLFTDTATYDEWFS